MLTINSLVDAANGVVRLRRFDYRFALYVSLRFNTRLLVRELIPVLAMYYTKVFAGISIPVQKIYTISVDPIGALVERDLMLDETESQPMCQAD
jgi:hypothetical protein